jgi:oxygen-dependent protoporphyrinogen oxidase
MKTTWRVAVIGGGLSGLAAANRLQELSRHHGRPLDLVLFDSQPRLGGIVATRRIGEYRVELGADSFITSKPWAVDLCRRLNIENRLIPTDARYRRSLVLFRGKPVAVPGGFQLLAPTELAEIWRSPLFSARGKLRIALEYFLPRRRSDSDESLASFVRRRFGREALDRLVQPLVGGIYTSDPEKLSLRATMPRFLEMEEQSGSVIRALRREARSGKTDPTASGARYGLFTAPSGGISELVEALVARVRESAQIRLETEVARLVPEGGGRGFIVELAEAEHDSFDAVVLATPAYRAAAAIEGFAPTAARELTAIEYASTAIVVSGHRLADVREPLDAFGLVVPVAERRQILAVSFASRKFPGRAPEGCVQLRTFVGGAMQPELPRLADEELIAIARRELEEIFGITWKPEFCIVARWNRSMPQYHVGHLVRAAVIESEIAGHPRLALAGNALHGVGIPDSIHSGERAAERVFAAGRQ